MTAKEKARKLLHQHYKIIVRGTVGAYHFREALNNGCSDISDAYKCTLITVNEALSEAKGYDRYKYWKDVKIELEKL